HKPIGDGAPRPDDPSPNDNIRKETAQIAAIAADDNAPTIESPPSKSQSATEKARLDQIEAARRMLQQIEAAPKAAKEIVDDVVGDIPGVVRDRSGITTVTIDPKTNKRIQDGKPVADDASSSDDDGSKINSEVAAIAADAAALPISP